MTDREKVTQRIAQVWCMPEHSHKDIDADLAHSIVEVVLDEFVDRQWKETVRDIFDECHRSGRSLGGIVNLIEENHYDYFCEGKSIEQWKEEEK